MVEVFKETSKSVFFHVIFTNITSKNNMSANTSYPSSTYKFMVYKDLFKYIVFNLQTIFSQYQPSIKKKFD